MSLKLRPTRLPLPRIVTRLPVIVLMVVLHAAPLLAQDSRTIRTLTAGPSFVNFDEYGGSFGAAVAWFSIDRVSERLLGSEFAFFLLAPLGGASIQADCPAGVVCESKATPGLLYGGLFSGLARGGESGLRAAFGLGAVGAAGGEGLENRSSITGHVGLDWVAGGSGRYALTVTVRLLLLTSPIAGARQVLLPGIGVTF